MSLSWLAIANPLAGRPREAVTAGEGLLRENLIRSLVVGAVPGDGTRSASEAHQYDGIVAIGGDGTIAEILAGFDPARQRIAVIPAGHGNCLARDLGVARLADAVAALRVGVTEAIDLLRVRVVGVDGTETIRWAASTLAVGYVADVVLLGRGRLARLGHLAYAAATLFTRPRPRRIDVTIDGRPSDASWPTGVVINNTAHLANFRAFHAARLSDGVLDVMIQRCGWGRQTLHNGAIVAGSRAFGPVRLVQGRNATVRSDDAFTVMVDGELVPHVVRLDVACVPSALHCVVRAP